MLRQEFKMNGVGNLLFYTGAKNFRTQKLQKVFLYIVLEYEEINFPEF